MYSTVLYRTVLYSTGRYYDRVRKVRHITARCTTRAGSSHVGP